MNSSDHNISVCALVPYPPDSAPSQRYRIEQWLPYLAAQGISVDLVPFMDRKLQGILYQPGRHITKIVAGAAAIARRALHVAAIRKYDVVMIHRAVCIAGPAWLERAIPLLHRPVIFDFDDAIFLLQTTEANRHLGWLKFPGKTAAICRLSSHVVVGNDFLGDYAQQYNSRVTVVPTSVDTELFQPTRKNGSNGRIVIGWTGSSTSQAHLEMFTPVLRKLIARRNVEIRVHSNLEPQLPGVPFVWRPWSAKTEVEELSHFDIGIMPLPDNQWARGKCSMKALLYMAMGTPAVCSAVGTNCVVIRHGENGLLARTTDEWLHNLELLIDNPSLRSRLGAAGRNTIEARYSMRQSAPLFAQVVRDAVEQRRAASAPRRVASQFEQEL